jgi:TniQ protein
VNRYSHTQLQLVTDRRPVPSTLVLRARPKDDESYLGFLLRLTDINGYPAISWILKVAKIPSNLRLGAYIARAEVDFPRVAKLNDSDVSDLGELAYLPVTYKYDGPVLGSSSPPHVLRLRRPKVCPQCLRDSNYLRKQWDYSAVTSCPTHRTLLLEECPACSKRINWFRKKVSHCRCGADWREAQTQQLDAQEIVVSRLIYRTLGLIPQTKRESTRSNPLYGLELSSLLGVLFFVCTQQREKSRATLSFPQMNIPEIHSVLLKAFSVFERWPANFRRFLDEQCSKPKSSTSSNGLLNRFGSFGRQLYRASYLPDDIGETLRKEFESYVFENWEEGYGRAPSWFRYRGACKYIARKEAAQILNLGLRAIDDLISNRTLKGMIFEKPKRRLTLVEAAGVEELRVRLSDSISLRDASRILGISEANVSRLVENSVLVAADISTAGFFCRFDQVIVNELLRNAMSKVIVSNVPAENELGNFRDVVERLAVRLASSRWGIHTFVRDILDGLIVPRGENPNKTGLRRLQFSRGDVAEYVEVKLAGKDADTLFVLEKGARLSLRPRALYFLARKDLIQTKSSDRTGKSGTITREAVLAFHSQYVTGRAIASEVGTSIQFLVPALISLGIRPVSGRSVDDGPIYVFKKSAIDPACLKDVKSRPGKRGRIRSAPINSTETAQILSIRTKDVSALVKNGVIRPYQDSLKSERTYRFNRSYVEGYQEQFTNLTDLISGNAAAQLLHIALPTLNYRWIKPGYLKYQVSKDGKKKLLLKKDVEAAASFVSSVVNEKDAARWLRVSRNFVERCARRGLLQTIVNPYARVFKSRIYLKSELANLRVVDDETGSFRKTLVRADLLS